MRATSACLLLSIILGCCGSLDHANAQGDFMVTDSAATITTEAQDLVGEVVADSFAAPKSEVVGETIEPIQTLLDFDRPAEFQTGIPSVASEDTQTEGHLAGDASAEQWPADGLADAALPTTALTQDLNRTISVAGGANWLDGDSGYVISAVIGKRLSKRLRFDVEFAHRSNNEEQEVPIFHPVYSRITSKVKIDANSIMTNLFLDWNNATRFTPYTGAGIGVSFIHFEDQATGFGDAGQVLEQAGLGDNDTVFAWQGISGISYGLSALSDLFVEYRYFATTEVIFNRLGTVGNYNANNLILGFRKKF